MPLLALGHKMALSLLTLMLGSALATKPRATKRSRGATGTAMVRSLGFGLDRNAEPQPVDSAAVKLIKRGTEYDILKNRCSGVSDAIDEALVALEHSGYIALPACRLLSTKCGMAHSMTSKIAEFLNTWHCCSPKMDQSRHGKKRCVNSYQHTHQKRFLVTRNRFRRCFEPVHCF